MPSDCEFLPCGEMDGGLHSNMVKQTWPETHSKKHIIIIVNSPTRVYFTVSITDKAGKTIFWMCLPPVKWPIIRGPAPALVSAVKLWKVSEFNQAEGGGSTVAAQQAQSNCSCTDDIILALAVLFYWLPVPALVAEFCTGELEKCLQQLTSRSDNNLIC